MSDPERPVQTHCPTCRCVLPEHIPKDGVTGMLCACGDKDHDHAHRRRPPHRPGGAVSLAGRGRERQMSDQVARWDMERTDVDGHEMVLDKDGGWVEYADHLRIVGELRAQVEGATAEAEDARGKWLAACANIAPTIVRMQESERERDAALAQLADLRADLEEQCRLLGAGGSREARLMAEVEGLRRELERERAKREAWND